MVNPYRFYTYAYLRKDKTPYYIGKGAGNRAYNKSAHTIPLPKDKSRVIFLKQNLTEEEAFKHEIYMIAVFGRKDLGTGILHNKTNGGEGSSGTIQSQATRNKRSEALKGRVFSQESKDKMSAARKGRKLSEEAKRKISEFQKGKKHSEEYKKNMSRVIKKTMTNERKERMKEGQRRRREREALEKLSIPS